MAQRRTAGQQLPIFLQPAPLERFWSKRLSLLGIPNAKLETIHLNHQAALSTGSFLVRLEIRLRVGKKIHHLHLRGNATNPGTVAIYRALTRAHLSIATPRVIAYLPRHKFFWYQEVPGNLLRDVPFTSPRFQYLVKKTGQALRQIQTVRPANIRPLRWADERAQIGKHFRAAVVSGDRPLLEKVHKTLIRQLPAVWTGRTIVHNDFQGSNILVEGKKINVIDFSLGGVGHPMVDVGAFLAHLLVMTLADCSPRQQQQLRTAFIRGYQGAAPLDALRRLPLFELRVLLDVLAITMTYLGPKHSAGRRYAAAIHRRMEEILAHEL